MNRKRITSFLILIVSGLLGLTACGGSGGGESTGTLNIGLTDSPIVSAKNVVIQFTGLELKPAGGPPEVFNINPDACEFVGSTDSCSIDLLTLQGMEYRTLFGKKVPAGDYQWIRLLVNAERTVHDSYIIVDGEQQCSLWIPSGADSGLKIFSDITVTANGVSNYMLDFDVRTSITAPPGLPSGTPDCLQDYILKPTIRIVDETESGSIAGTVSPDLLSDESCRDVEEPLGVVDNLDVYVFENFGTSPVEMDDYDGDGDPIASAMVEWNGTDYTYEVGYLRGDDGADTYRLGLTCTADVDVMPGEVDKIADNFGCDAEQNPSTCMDTTPPFSFIAEIDVPVVIDAIADGTFPAPSPTP